MCLIDPILGLCLEELEECAEKHTSRGGSRQIGCESCKGCACFSDQAAVEGPLGGTRIVSDASWQQARR